MVGDDALREIDLHDDRRRDLELVHLAECGTLHGTFRAGPHAFGRHRRMHRCGRMPAIRRLDHDPLRPGQPVRHLLGQRVVAGHEAHRDAPCTERQGVEPVLARGSAVEPGLDRRIGIGVRDRAAGMARAGVVTDEEGDVEAGGAIRPRLRARDHRPRLLALEDRRLAMDVRRLEVVHPAVAVVDEDARGTTGQGSLDGGVRLGDHQVDGRRVLGVLGLGRRRVADATDALHVDADVDPHVSASALGRAG